MMPSAVAGLLLASAPGIRADPAASAIEHLQRIIEGEVNLDAGTDTAISPHVGLGKKNQIREWLGRMANDLKGGELEVGKTRIDDNLAGVIIHKREGYDPDKIAAFAVALVRSGEHWMPAPVTASFENTGITLDFEMRKRAAELERWMLRERTRALDTLRDRQIELMRQDISTAITREELANMDVAGVSAAFLHAVRERDRLRMLGLLGGLSDPLPRDWSTRLQAGDFAASAGEETPKAWRILASKAVPRAIVWEESSARDGLFTIGFIDPAGEVPRGGVPGVGLFHIDMERDSGGAWRINLPAAFTETVSQKPEDPDSPFDTELINAFPKSLRKIHPAAPQESAEALWEMMRQAMSAASPDELLRLLLLPQESPEQARQALGRATRFWWQLRFANGGRTIMPLAFHQHGDQAMAMVQLFAFREPERTDIRIFHMVRIADGWLWQSTTLRKDPIHPISEELAEWRNTQEGHWRNNWVNAILEPTAKIQTLEPQSPVDPEVAVSTVRHLLEAIKAEDVTASLANSAVLDDPEGHARLLRNLGHELSIQVTEIDGDVITRTGKHWTVVCYRRRDDVNPGMALMPVVSTPEGPRVLMELDLFVGTRQREFLNNVALERLDEYTDGEMRAELRKMLQELNREFAPGRR